MREISLADSDKPDGKKKRRIRRRGRMIRRRLPCLLVKWSGYQGDAQTLSSQLCSFTQNNYPLV